MIFPDTFLATESVASFSPPAGSRYIGAADSALDSQVGPDLGELVYLRPVADEVALNIDVPPDLEGLIVVPGQIEGRESAPLGFSDRWVPRIGVGGSPCKGLRPPPERIFYERSAFPGKPESRLSRLDATA